MPPKHRSQSKWKLVDGCVSRSDFAGSIKERIWARAHRVETAQGILQLGQMAPLFRQIVLKNSGNTFLDFVAQLVEHHKSKGLWFESSYNKCRPILVQGLRHDIEINFHSVNINGSVAQLIEWSASALKVPGSNSGLGEFFSSIPFNEEMNQMVNKKNNNSSNSLDIGRWPQTKMLLGLL